MPHPHYRPGQVIRFTYRHFWPPDEHTRDTYKQILVIHNNWAGKVHGIDLSVLSDEQIKIFKYVMNPEFNKERHDEAEMKRSLKAISDQQKKKKEQKDGLEQIEQKIKDLNKQYETWVQDAKAKGGQVPPEYKDFYANKMAELNATKNELAAEEAQPTEEKKQEIEKLPIPPLAKEILQKMRPAKMVNNPYLFYNTFLKYVLGLWGKPDVYRTFFPLRMDAVQPVERWEWVKADEVKQPAQQGLFGGPQKPQVPQKGASGMKAVEPPALKKRREELAMRQTPTFRGQKPLPPGAAQGGVLSTPAGTSRPAAPAKPARPAAPARPSMPAKRSS